MISLNQEQKKFLRSLIYNPVTGCPSLSDESLENLPGGFLKRFLEKEKGNMTEMGKRIAAEIIALA
jgi:hypothetical protein